MDTQDNTAGVVAGFVHQRMQLLAAAEKDAARQYGVTRRNRDDRDHLFHDAESAVQWAVRSARRTGCGVRLFEYDGCPRNLGEIAFVTPDGHVDLTWRGSELISCAKPARKAKAA